MESFKRQPGRAHTIAAMGIGGLIATCVAFAVLLSGSTCGTPGLVLGDCSSLAQQAVAKAQSNDYCGVAQIDLQALDAGCFGNSAEFPLATGMTVDQMRTQLQQLEQQICTAQ